MRTVRTAAFSAGRKYAANGRDDFAEGIRRKYRHRYMAAAEAEMLHALRDISVLYIWEREPGRFVFSGGVFSDYRFSVRAVCRIGAPSKAAGRSGSFLRNRSESAAPRRADTVSARALSVRIREPGGERKTTFRRHIWELTGRIPPGRARERQKRKGKETGVGGILYRERQTAHRDSIFTRLLWRHMLFHISDRRRDCGVNVRLLPEPERQMAAFGIGNGREGRRDAPHRPVRCGSRRPMIPCVPIHLYDGYCVVCGDKGKSAGVVPMSKTGAADRLLRTESRMYIHAAAHLGRGLRRPEAAAVRPMRETGRERAVWPVRFPLSYGSRYRTAEIRFVRQTHRYDGEMRIKERFCPGGGIGGVKRRAARMRTAGALAIRTVFGTDREGAGAGGAYRMYKSRRVTEITRQIRGAPEMTRAAVWRILGEERAAHKTVWRVPGEERAAHKTVWRIPEEKWETYKAVWRVPEERWETYRAVREIPEKERAAHKAVRRMSEEIRQSYNIREVSFRSLLDQINERNRQAVPTVRQVRALWRESTGRQTGGDRAAGVPLSARCAQESAQGRPVPGTEKRGQKPQERERLEKLLGRETMAILEAARKRRESPGGSGIRVLTGEAAELRLRHDMREDRIRDLLTGQAGTAPGSVRQEAAQTGKKERGGGAPGERQGQDGGRRNTQINGLRLIHRHTGSGMDRELQERLPRSGGHIRTEPQYMRESVHELRARPAPPTDCSAVCEGAPIRDLDAVIRRHVRQQADSISERVYAKIEKRLEAERRRRGL